MLEKIHRRNELHLPHRNTFFESVPYFVQHASFDTYPIVKEDEKRIIRRLFKGDDSYSKIPGVTFSFDIDEKKQYQSEVFSRKFIFEYTIPSIGEVKQKNVAQMHFEERQKNEFVLFHRYVSPDYRKQGLSVRLFQLAEEWFLNLSQELHFPVMFTLQTGQRSVFIWAEKMGFSVSEDSQKLYEEICNHPDLFFEDDVIVSEESQRQGILKDKYVFRLGAEGRYMEDAIRITFVKKIEPTPIE